MRPWGLLMTLGVVGLPSPNRLPAGGGVKPAPRRWVLVAAGTQARYRVREQLASLSFPSDAVGTTAAVTGAITFDAAGHLMATASQITVDLTTLKSDRERRDRFIQGRTLQTDSFPTAVLVPTGLQGAPKPLPTRGSFAFQLTGDLTVHGVTRPTSWQVTAQAKDGDYTGTAATHVKFEDFGLTPPRVAVVLSVADDIALELDFHFTPAAGEP
jgi:polyisoprenoid-binding protein YceI